MLEQNTIQTATQYVFHPSEDEKRELFTNDDVVRLATDETCRYELIGGEIIVSTAPRFIHQLLSMRISEQFLDYLKKNPLGYILTTPGLIFSEFDGVIPDLIFITHERCDEILHEESGKFHGAPELVIEILSPGRANARRDLQIKRELYEFFAVPEYWVIKPQEKQVETFRRGKDGLTENRIFEQNEILSSPILPKFKLKIRNLFAD